VLQYSEPFLYDDCYDLAWNLGFILFQMRRASRTAPIVIKQALHCGDEGLKIWGTEIQIVSLVARIRNIRMQSTKITYTIQDITGRMRAVLWIDQEAMEEDVC
jgi:hypothetical protein